jgi:hypothetical protein
VEGAICECRCLCVSKRDRLGSDQVKSGPEIGEILAGKSGLNHWKLNSEFQQIERARLRAKRNKYTQ